MRKSGIGKLEAFFSVLYIKHTDRVSEKMNVEEVGNGIFSHPHGWFGEGENTRRTATTLSTRLIEALFRLFAGLSKNTEKIKKEEKETSFSFLRSMCGNIKKNAFVYLSVILALCFAFTVFQNADKTTVIGVYVGGEYIGDVESAFVYESAMNAVRTHMMSVTGECFDFPEEICFKITNKDDPRLLDKAEVAKKLEAYTTDIITSAYGLYIDADNVAVLMSRDDITSCLDELVKDNFNKTGVKSQIANRVEIRYGEYASGNIISKEELKVLLTSSDTDRLLDSGDILLAGNAVADDSIAGEIQKNILEAAKVGNASRNVVITYENISEEVIYEKTPYITKYVPNDDLYKGQTNVLQFGHDGLSEITYQIATSEDGKEISRTEISRVTVYGTTDEIISVGAKELPENAGATGKKVFIRPLASYEISDTFGWRTLRGKTQYHQGIDFSAPYGTSIYAAGSGEVIYADYYSGYGKIVKIKHGDGTITSYSHCSEILVCVGDEVAQGQLIAEVGATGDATGNHCHFEVTVDGTKVNPANYFYD